MKKRKVLASAIAIALAAIICIGGTLAYFTDFTDQKDNLFSVSGGSGDDIFNIELTEPKWDSYQKDENGKAVIEPGITIPKDPTVTLTNDAYANGAWVKVSVVISGVPNSIGAFGFRNYLQDIPAQGLNTVAMPRTDEEVLNGTCSVLLTWLPVDILNLNDSITMFTGVKFPDNMTKEELAAFSNLKISVKAYAVSAEGLTYDDARTPLDELDKANPIV